MFKAEQSTRNEANALVLLGYFPWYVCVSSVTLKQSRYFYETSYRCQSTLDDMQSARTITLSFILYKIYPFVHYKIMSTMYDTKKSTMYDTKKWRDTETQILAFSTQLSTKFQLLIKTRMRKNKDISCIRAFRCCIYPANKCWNANHCWHFNIYEQDKFHSKSSGLNVLFRI